MIPVSNIVNWRADVNKPLISNADIIIQDQNNNTLTKKNIVKYSHKESRRFIGETYPIKEITFTIAKYSSLGFILGNTLRITYKINNITTSKARVYYVDSIDVDKKSDTAVVKASWYYVKNSDMFKTMVVFDSGDNYNYQDMKVKDFLSWIYEGNYQPTDFYISQGLNPRVSSLFNIENMSSGEMLQNLAIVCGGALDDNLETNYSAPVVIRAFSTIFDDSGYQYYSNTNIVEIKESEDEFGSNFVLNKVELEGEETLIAQGDGIRSQMSGVITLKDNQYYVERLASTSGTPSQTAFKQYPRYATGTFWQGGVYYTFSTSPSTSYTISAYGRKMTLEHFASQGNRVISSPFINSSNITQLNSVATKYFANTKLATITGRIDPSYETLDIFRLENSNTTKWYCIEEINYEFNGGFFGKMKVREMENLLLPVVISNLNIATDTFTLTNRCNFSVDAYASYNSNSIYLGSINANSARTFSNVAQLQSAFADKRNGTLSQYVFVYFRNGNDIGTFKILLSKDT